jgi:hypothetical protein
MKLRCGHNQRVELGRGPVRDPASAVKLALRALARRWQALQAEIDDLDTQLVPLVTAVARDSWRCPGSGWVPPGMARRTAEGKTKTEIMRCLKRYIAREVIPHLPTAAPGAASQRPESRKSAS